MGVVRMVLSKFSVKTWSENLFGIDSVHWFRSVSDADNLVSDSMCLISDWDFTQSDSVILLNKIFIALSLVETEGVLLNKTRYEKCRRWFLLYGICRQVSIVCFSFYLFCTSLEKFSKNLVRKLGTLISIYWFRYPPDPVNWFSQIEVLQSGTPGSSLQ